MCVLGYCDTEHLLSNDIDSEHWYARGDSMNPYENFSLYRKGIYRLVPDKYRPDVVYGSDNYNGMWLYKFYDSTLTDTVRHDSFQSHVEIGTVDGQCTRTFAINKDAVVASGSVVKLVGNTTFKFDSAKTLFVNGDLYIKGGVTFDTSNVNKLSNIVCKSGGKVYIGGDDEEINGFHTMTIDSGGFAVIKSGTVLNFMRGGVINVYGELQLNDVTFNDQSRLVCYNGGKIIICPKADINKLKVLVVNIGGTLEVKDSSVTNMSRDGIIKIHGIMNASLTGNQSARFDVWCSGCGWMWQGIVMDSIPSATNNSSTLSNLFIHRAKSGITTVSNAPSYKSQPLIRNCELSENEIGITITNDSPTLIKNRFERNTVGGLVGYYMSTVVDSNRFTKNYYFGAKLYHCGNLWTCNVIDSNYVPPFYTGYGILCDELVTVPFNQYTATYSGPPYYDCDTTAGNSMRYNKTGIHLDDMSAVTFECDNSLHDNVFQEIILLDTASVIGYANYPGLGAGGLKLYNPFPQYTTFKWGDTLSTESVFLKSNVASQSSPTISRQPADDRFTVAMDEAESFQSRKQYSLASAKFREAMSFARARWEAERCITRWQHLLHFAIHNAPSDDPLCAGSIGPKVDHLNALTEMRTANYPTWMQNTASEFLAGHYMHEKQYAEAQSIYDALSNLYESEPVIARRALMAKVILKHRGLGDYDGAYEVYQAIERRYPRTKAVLFAKIDLGLPLTDEDRAVLTDSIMSKMSVEKNVDEAESTSHTFILYPAFPNPFGRATFGNPTTTIRYRLPTSSKVKLTVFTLLGKEVKMIVDREEKEGVYSVEYDGSSLGSGTYMYRLQAQELESGNVRVLERKMTVLK